MKNVRSRLGVLGELMSFLWTRKRWWLIPMIVALVLVSVLVVLGATGVFSPFLYSLF